MNEMIASFIQWLLNASSAYLMPIMCVAFAIGTIFRLTVKAVTSGQSHFTAELEKRIMRHRDGAYKDTRDLPFTECIKSILNKTHYETFILPLSRRGRAGDVVQGMFHRLFMLHEASIRLVNSTVEDLENVSQTEAPDFDTITEHCYNNNHFYSNLMGVIPMSTVNRFLSILPGLFVVGGIFGTFVGIMMGLPMLQNIDVTNIDKSSKVLNEFIVYMGFSIGTSVFGVFLSVLMQVLNTWNAVEDEFMEGMGRYRNSIALLWYERKSYFEKNAGAVSAHTATQSTTPITAPVAETPAYYAPEQDTSVAEYAAEEVRHEEVASIIDEVEEVEESAPAPVEMHRPVEDEYEEVHDEDTLVSALSTVSPTPETQYEEHEVESALPDLPPPPPGDDNLLHLKKVS